MDASVSSSGGDAISPTMLKIIIIGNAGVGEQHLITTTLFCLIFYFVFCTGKTSLLERFIEPKNAFSKKYKATIGADFKFKRINVGLLLLKLFLD